MLNLKTIDKEKIKPNVLLLEISNLFSVIQCDNCLISGFYKFKKFSNVNNPIAINRFS